MTMKYNSQIMKFLPAPNRSNRVTSGVCCPTAMSNGSTSARETHPDGDIESNDKDGEKDQDSKTDKFNVLAKSESGAECSEAKPADYGAPNLEPLYKDIDQNDKQTLSDRTLKLFSLPWYYAFKYTVPNCQEEGWENWYFVTFTNSIAWIGLISWFMVEWPADIGCVLGIPSAIMGVTVLAAGTSIPDALSSIVVAKQGMGDMAVANAVGSNVFDIWLGLGLPWLFVVPFKEDGNNRWGKYIHVDNDELLPNVLILFGVLMFYLASVILAKWKLYRKEGYLFLALYVVYALYNIVGVWVLDIYNQEDK